MLAFRVNDTSTDGLGGRILFGGARTRLPVGSASWLLAAPCTGEETADVARAARSGLVGRDCPKLSNTWSYFDHHGLEFGQPLITLAKQCQHSTNIGQHWPTLAGLGPWSNFVQHLCSGTGAGGPQPSSRIRRVGSRLAKPNALMLARARAPMAPQQANHSVTHAKERFGKETERDRSAVRSPWRRRCLTRSWEEKRKFEDIRGTLWLRAQTLQHISAPGTRSPAMCLFMSCRT